MKNNGRKVSVSQVETRYLLMPDHANPFGTAFGGVIMSWIDTTAAMAAQKHCQMDVATVSIDRISFDAPAYIGDHIILRASLNYVGNTSMEVGVTVITENPLTGKQIKTTSAYLTFVALDKNKKPCKVPPLILETSDDQRRFENAKIRVQARKDLHRQLKK